MIICQLLAFSLVVMFVSFRCTHASLPFLTRAAQGICAHFHVIHFSYTRYPYHSLFPLIQYTHTRKHLKSTHSAEKKAFHSSRTISPSPPLNLLRRLIQPQQILNRPLQRRQAIPCLRHHSTRVRQPPQQILQAQQSRNPTLTHHIN